MKHIRRKFLYELHNPDLVQKVESEGAFITLDNLSKAPNPKGFEGYNAFYVLKDNRCLPTFKYRDSSKKRYFIPEPDPVLIYFNNAQTNLRFVHEKRTALLEMVGDAEKHDVARISHALYNFMYHSSSFTIFLFTAIEATVNKTIPDKYFYAKKGPKSTEIFDVNQIQRYLSFAEKVKHVLPDITKRDFSKTFQSKYTQIEKLKEFRDTIIHTKKEGQEKTYGNVIIKAALDFNYSNSIVVVKDFINFYYPNLVEECGCGMDY